MTKTTATLATAPQPAGTRGSLFTTSRAVAASCMMAGIAWNAGLEARPFHPVMTGVTALALHGLPLIALIMVVLRAQRRSLAGLGTGRGISIAALIALAFGAFSALFSITHPHAVMGIHDINDVLPIAILDAGALLWLVSGRQAAVGATGG